MKDQVSKRREQILFGNVWKVILIVALPVMVNQIVVQVYNLFDTYFSSLIGETELSATVFVAPINTTVSAIALGIGIAGTATVAKYIGSKDYDKARQTIGQMITIVSIVVVFVVGFSFMFSKEILYTASLRGDILEKADSYFKIILLATPFVFLNNTYLSLCRAQGNTLRVMILNVIAIIFKLILNYIFIVHLGQGIIGLAIATVLSRMFVSVYAFYDIFIKDSVLKVGLKELKFTKSIAFPLIILAIPLIIERSTQSFGHVLVSGQAYKLGEDVLSAYGITNRLNSIAFSSVSGIGVAVVALVSQNLAVFNRIRVREIYLKSILLGMGFAALLISVVFLISKPYASMFAGEGTEVYRHTLNAIAVYSISVFPFGFVQIMNGIFQGYKKTHYTMINALLRLWVFRVLLIYILVQYTNLQEYGLWYGMLISNVLSAIVAYVIYKLDKDFRIGKDEIYEKDLVID